jgi:hypothetical protein
MKRGPQRAARLKNLSDRPASRAAIPAQGAAFFVPRRDTDGGGTEGRDRSPTEPMRRFPSPLRPMLAERLHAKRRDVRSASQWRLASARPNVHRDCGQRECTVQVGSGMPAHRAHRRPALRQSRPTGPSRSVFEWPILRILKAIRSFLPHLQCQCVRNIRSLRVSAAEMQP